MGTLGFTLLFQQEPKKKKKRGASCYLVTTFIKELSTVR